MKALFLKEIRSFFGSLIAYIVIITFLIAIGLFMWIFPDTNVLDYGYSNMDTLFSMAPFIFIFLISAITMRSFSEEKRIGTIESLTTKPITDWGIIMAKYFANLSIVCMALLPTIIYYISIVMLGSPTGNIDGGATFGSYIGLLCLGSCYIAIGLFASSLTDNQIVSFIISMFICFFCYTAFEQLSKMELFGTFDYFIENLGIDIHYQSVSRGVIDTRDIIYFAGFTAFFLGLTQFIFGSRKW